MNKNSCPGKENLIKILLCLTTWHDPLYEPGTLEDMKKAIKMANKDFDPKETYEEFKEICKEHQEAFKLSYQWGKNKEEIISNLRDHVLHCDNCYQGYLIHFKTLEKATVNSVNLQKEDESLLHLL